MRPSSPALALCAALACSAGAARAQAPVPAESVLVVGPAAERRAFDAPYAVGVVDVQALRAGGPMVNLSEALARVPGLVVALRGNYAQDLQISSRGFGARASFGVRGLRLLSDGIPASGPDGQGQVSHFDLAGADRVEVLRGPFSALYGTSSGGVIALASRAPAERAAMLDLDRGSDGLRQWRLGLALPIAGGFSLRAGLSDFAVDGFRPNSAARRRLANLRAGWDDPAGHDRVVVVLNALDQPAQDPLGLTRAQLAADPDQTTPQALQFATRKDTAQAQAGVQWAHRFADAGALQRATLAAYQGRRSVTQWQAIAPATQAAAGHPGGVIDFDRRYGGLDARLAWRLDGARLVAGVALDQQREDRRGFENFVGSGAAQVLGVTGRLRRDEANRARSADAFAQGELELAPDWSATLGLRHGRLRVDSADRYLANGDDAGALAFGYTLPVMALRWQPVPAWSLYASAGRGHESPTLNELAYRPDGGRGFNTALRAQTSRQLELGAKWREAGRGDGAAVDLALFEAASRDEIAVQTNSGGRSSFRNVGRTLRRGAELSAQWRPAPGWRAQGALTLLEATYRDPFLACAGTPCTAPTLPVAPGGRIAGTLPSSVFAELAWGGDAFELAAEARAQGRQPVNDANSDFAGGFALLALRACGRVALGGSDRLEWLARLDNVADRRVAGSVIVNEGNARFFEPAPGRGALLSLRWVHGF